MLGCAGGDKAPGGIQRATIATVGGGGEIGEVPREDASGDLLHMPQFDDMEVEGTVILFSSPTRLYLTVYLYENQPA